MPAQNPSYSAPARLTPQQIADMMLNLHRERCQYLKIGATVWADECDVEIERLAKMFQSA